MHHPSILPTCRLTGNPLVPLNAHKTLENAFARKFWSNWKGAGLATGRGDWRWASISLQASKGCCFVGIYVVVDFAAARMEAKGSKGPLPCRTLPQPLLACRLSIVMQIYFQMRPVRGRVCKQPLLMATSRSPYRLVLKPISWKICCSIPPRAGWLYCWYITNLVLN